MGSISAVENPHPQDCLESWKYRGQVLPESRRIVTEIEVSGIGRDQRGTYAVAQGWLWVDGVRVSHAADLAMRIVSNAGAQS